ncbi:MAG: ROK family transcriptional regulator [Propionibacteriaceae bacterium]|jgi:predicted NBD/HSP70 family sugar kinase|nr:ROK family transcriptional regulator [Propionibacteriaceae bacterium]
MKMPESSDAVVLWALREHGPLSRDELAKLTGLSLGTVNRHLAPLTASGIVVVTGYGISSGGRPPELFAYHGAGQLIAGVSVTDYGATVLVLTLDDQITQRHELTFSAADDPEARLRYTVDLLEKVISQADGRLASIGVAVPGVVGSNGTVTAIHELGWDRLALGALLSRHAGGLPVTLSNDANCLAIAEHRRGAGRGIDNLVALVARNGLGAGLITNGQLYGGANQEAGEIGYLLTERASLRRLFPERGELEQRLGQARSHAAKALGVETDQVGLPSLIRLGRDNPTASDTADELLDLTALAISAMCVVLDPELIILGGDGDAIGTAALIAGIRERLIGRILRVPRLEPAALGTDAIMIGAAYLSVSRLGHRNWLPTSLLG